MRSRRAPRWPRSPQKLKIGLIYKTSFDKANRSSLGGERGIGLEAGLPILAEVRETTGLPVLTDIHAPEQCAPVAEVVDVLQTPAFLCRQTDLLLAAGATGKPVNIKKGQFLAPWDMQNAAAKVASTGNERILLCERGAMLRLQHAGRRHALAADHGARPATRSCSTRRMRWRPRRPRRPLRRRARIRPGTGARRRRDRRRRDLPRNPPRPRPFRHRRSRRRCCR